MLLRGADGKTWEIENSVLSRGGEGEIHSILNQPGLAAKLYQPGVLDSARKEKLAYMTRLYSDTNPRFTQLAWPQTVLKDATGSVCGFVMRRFDTSEDLANLLDESADAAMQLSWYRRIMIALNLAVLVENIHSMDQVIGDMNPKNFGVNMANGFLAAFDTDSFHLLDNGSRRYYPCRVMDPHYTAPELLERLRSGARIDSLRPEDTFSRETDLFALAVLIFHLLFNGAHPFTAAREKGAGSVVAIGNREENIARKMSPFFNPDPHVTIPGYAPSLNIVPKHMQEAFRQAFLTMKRPEASQWVSMLKSLRGQVSMGACGHYYVRGNGKCPWCARSRAMQKKHAVRPLRQAPTAVQTAQQAGNAGQPPLRPAGPAAVLAGNGTAALRAVRPLQLSEYLNLLTWGAAIVLDVPDEPYYLWLGFFAALLAMLFRNRNETRPAGALSRVLAWWNLVIGACLLVSPLLTMIGDGLPDGQTTELAMMGAVMALYGYRMVRGNRA